MWAQFPAAPDVPGLIRLSRRSVGRANVNALWAHRVSPRHRGADASRAPSHPLVTHKCLWPHTTRAWLRRRSWVLLGPSAGPGPSETTRGGEGDAEPPTTSSRLVDEPDTSPRPPGQLSHANATTVIQQRSPHWRCS